MRMEYECFKQSTETGEIAVLTDDFKKPLLFRNHYGDGANPIEVYYYKNKEQWPLTWDLLITDHIGFPSDVQGTFWYSASQKQPILIVLPQPGEDEINPTVVYVPAELNRNHSVDSNHRVAEFIRYNDLLHVQIATKGHGRGTVVRIVTSSDASIRAVVQFDDGTTMPMDYQTILEREIK
ncbi:hypothetical protein ACI3E1_07025 [Ligilactobacillus sp. LYQ139]|uniref:hypothetical protein n=1 Tax=Ligilactobacillus sp. LYQ139 TaxID=3378800 RepID=UPI003852D648